MKEGQQADKLPPGTAQLRQYQAYEALAQHGLRYVARMCSSSSVMCKPGHTRRGKANLAKAPKCLQTLSNCKKTGGFLLFWAFAFLDEEALPKQSKRTENGKSERAEVTSPTIACPSSCLISLDPRSCPIQAQLNRDEAMPTSGALRRIGDGDGDAAGSGDARPAGSAGGVLARAHVSSFLFLWNALRRSRRTVLGTA